MPRHAKGPRLTLETGADGTARYVIRDGQSKRRTGCGVDDVEGAGRALERYLAEKHRPDWQRDADPREVLIADVIATYARDVVPRIARPTEAVARMKRILAAFGRQTVADVTRASCMAYAANRGHPTSARRELEALRAAIRHAHESRVLIAPVPVWMPEKAPPRDRHLTRSEAARLIWTAWRLRQHYRGEPTARHVARHVARFILIALYTGTRAGAICAAAIRPTPGTGYVDLDKGVYYRKPPGDRQTKKKAPPVRLPDRLLAHLRRWDRTGVARTHVVEWNGRPVERISKAFRAVRLAAGLAPDVTPHVLKHTAVTWALQGGADPWQAAGYFGTSPETLMRIYGHHSPDHQQAVRAIMDGKPGAAGQKLDRNARTKRA